MQTQNGKMQMLETIEPIELIESIKPPKTRIPSIRRGSKFFRRERLLSFHRYGRLMLFEGLDLGFLGF